MVKKIYIVTNRPVYIGYHSINQDYCHLLLYIEESQTSASNTQQVVVQYNQPAGCKDIFHNISQF